MLGDSCVGITHYNMATMTTRRAAHDTANVHTIFCLANISQCRRLVVGMVASLTISYVILVQGDLFSNEIQKKTPELNIVPADVDVLVLRVPDHSPEGGRVKKRSKKQLQKLQGNKDGFYVNGVFIPHVNDSAQVKTIILWTTQFGSDTWSGVDKLGREMFYKHKCPVHMCNITRDHSLLDQASMLVFFFDDPPEWPKTRDPRQLYAHYTHEPPGPDQVTLYKDMDGKINLTMNYRSDADIPIPYQHFIQLPPNRMKRGLYNPRTPADRRTRSVVWPVSHCNASSKRDEYVTELSKYIDVDVVGACGNITCERKIWNTCYFKWEKEYRFFLSFENNYCQDYVTEKLFGTLSFEIVPVVFGFADYNKVAPPHSVIDVRDYESPKALAAYLRHLTDHLEEYNAYFQWKQTFEIEDGYIYKNVCRMCAAAHNTTFTEKRRAHANYSEWFLNACQNDIVDKWRPDW